jgi:hypothetical protein
MTFAHISNSFRDKKTPTTPMTTPTQIKVIDCLLYFPEGKKPTLIMAITNTTIRPIKKIPTGSICPP